MSSSTKTTRTELRAQLETLRLPRTAADLDDLLARATKGRWSASVVLEELARQELQERERRSLERRLRAAHLGRFKPIDEFDWNWPTKIDRTLIDRALSGELVRERENLVLVAAEGLGKTMLARNIAHARQGGRGTHFWPIRHLGLPGAQHPGGPGSSGPARPDVQIGHIWPSTVR